MGDRMDRFHCIILIVLSIFLVLGQTIAADTPNDMLINKTDKSLTLIDEAGRTVTVSIPVKRIISVDYTEMEALLALGAKDMIIGVDAEFHKAFPFFGLKEVPEIGIHGGELNYEQLVLLNSDIIILPFWKRDLALSIEKSLPNATVVVMGLNYRDKIVPELRIMGQLLGKESEAEKLIDWIKKYDGIVEERTKDLSADEMPTFYYEYMSDLDSKWQAIIPSQQYGGRVAEGCGGRNIASDINTNNTVFGIGSEVTVDPEWILKFNPDFIFLDFMDSKFAGAGRTEDDVKDKITKIIEGRADDGFGNFTAVRNNHISAIQQDYVCGPRWIIGHICFAKWLHPDLFNDLSVDQMNKEYFKEFHGMEVEGTWVYPVPQ